MHFINESPHHTGFLSYRNFEDRNFPCMEILVTCLLPVGLFPAFLFSAEFSLLGIFPARPFPARSFPR